MLLDNISFRVEKKHKAYIEQFGGPFAFNSQLSTNELLHDW